MKIRRLQRALVTVALVAGVNGPAQSTEFGEGARIHPALGERVMPETADEPALMFVHADDVGAARAAARAAGLRIVDSFERVGVAVAAGKLGDIDRLRRALGVRYLEQADTPVSFALETSHTATRGDEVIDGTDLGAFDGSGVSIAVIDTGIDGTHPMFQTTEGNKVVKNIRLACLPPEGLAGFSSCPSDHGAGENPWVDLPDTDLFDGHGTHVAGIAAGAEVMVAGHRLRGAAPGASLVGLSTGHYLGHYGPMAAMNWILENHDAPCGPGVDPADCPPIRIINNSWSIVEHYEHDPDGVAEKLQERLIAEGITLVWAAGNNGGDGTVSRTNGVAGTPTPGALMVAAYDDGNLGRRNWGLGWFSSRGASGSPETFPDVAAPGAVITSACRPNFPTCAPPTGSPARGDLDYGTVSGTSMASPHVAGIVALLLQADPALTPAMIEDVLEDTARPIAFGAEYEPDPSNADHRTSFDKGHGLVDAVSAIAAVLGRTAPASPSSCSPDGPVAADATADANGIVISQPVPSDPALDLVEARSRWDLDSGALTLSVDVADLQDSAAAFDVTFALRGERYFVEAARSTAGEERFSLGRVTTRERSLITSGLSGAFDTAADRVLVTLTTTDLVEAAGIDPLAEGEVLSEFVIASRRVLEGSLAAPLADAVEGRCPYTIGLGAVAPPGGLPPPPPDGAISSHDPIYRWLGETMTNYEYVFGCEGLSHHLGVHGNYPSGCERKLIRVSPPAGGATLDIEINADRVDNQTFNALTTDLDLFLFAPDGSMLGSHGVGGGNERITKRVFEPGVYTVMILGFLAVETGYDGEARLLL